MSSCNVCKVKVTKKKAPGLQCPGSCKKFYHKTCASISDEIFKMIETGQVSWLCVKCKRSSIVFPSGSDTSESPSNLNHYTANTPRTSAISTTQSP